LNATNSYTETDAVRRVRELRELRDLLHSIAFGLADPSQLPQQCTKYGKLVDDLIEFVFAGARPEMAAAITAGVL